MECRLRGNDGRDAVKPGADDNASGNAGEHRV